MDTVTAQKRSQIMASVRSKDTKPEIAVRKLVFRLGYRYRLHDTSLPGTPDLVFKSREKVIFVNGCFWHNHIGCPKARIPKSSVTFWKNKIIKNHQRDKVNLKALAEMGWMVLIIWECEIKDIEALSLRIINFLEDEN